MQVAVAEIIYNPLIHVAKIAAIIFSQLSYVATPTASCSATGCAYVSVPLLLNPLPDTLNAPMFYNTKELYIQSSCVPLSQYCGLGAFRYSSRTEY